VPPSVPAPASDKVTAYQPPGQTSAADVGSNSNSSRFVYPYPTMPLLLTAVGPPRVYTPGARRDEAAAGMSASTRSVVVVSLATSALWTAVSFIAPKLRAHWCTKLSSGAHSEGSGADGGKCKGGKVSNAKPAPTSDDPLFHQVLKDAADIYNHEPALRASTRRAILRHRTLENALSSILADKLCGCGGHSNHTWVALFDEVYAMHAKYRGSEGTPGALARLDLAAAGGAHVITSPHLSPLACPTASAGGEK